MLLIKILFLFLISATSILAVPSLDNSTATTATFTSKNVSFVGQTTSAIIGDSDHGNTTGIRVIDADGAGWSATMTSTNLTTIGNVKKLAGDNSTVGFTGVYDGLHGISPSTGNFTVEITTGGTVGVAIFKWTDPSGIATTNVTTAASVVLSNGVSATFASATYVIGDKWSSGVDVFPYSGMTVTPSSIFAEVGTLTGVTEGSASTLSGSGATSDSKTIMTATAGNGIGTYWQDLGLDLNIHSNPLSGSFGGIVVLTVS